MVLLFFALHLRTLSPPLLSHVKQSLLELANLYALSPPTPNSKRRKFDSAIDDLIGLCYFQPSANSSSDEDGRVVCASIPNYGNGKEAGNEAGYIVGMSTCYPEPGSLVINTGETLVLESNYSSSRKHTGVMGLFYILVADQLPRQTNFGDALLSKVEGIHMDLSGFVVLFVGIIVAVGISAFTVWRRNRDVDGYEPVSM